MSWQHFLPCVRVCCRTLTRRVDSCAVSFFCRVSVFFAGRLLVVLFAFCAISFFCRRSCLLPDVYFSYHQLSNPSIITRVINRHTLVLDIEQCVDGHCCLQPNGTRSKHGEYTAGNKHEHTANETNGTRSKHVA